MKSDFQFRNLELSNYDRKVGTTNEILVYDKVFSGTRTNHQANEPPPPSGGSNKR